MEQLGSRGAKKARSSGWARGSARVRDRSGSFAKPNEPNTSRNLGSFKKRAEPEPMVTRLG